MMSDKKVEYHNRNKCQKCGGVNNENVKDTINGHITEAETTCKSCGFKGYWAHGFFDTEPSDMGEQQCRLKR